MDTQKRISWEALEYEERERSTDYFWALGVIVVTSTITAIIYSNYFFALLILLSGILLFFFSKKSPETIKYTLTDSGLQIKSHLYLYKNIQSFYIELSNTPILFIKTERFFMPIISIPIDYAVAEAIYEIFIFENIIEEEMQEHASDKIIRTLGL